MNTNKEQEKITSLADFKRALTVGSKWNAYNHFISKNFGVRTVVKATSVGIEWNSGHVFNFPKASDLNFCEDGTIEVVRDDGELMLAYRKCL